MAKNGLKIAIYGKGGIGKSTTAANLAAAFAVQGQKVMQIGCDPKADSTRNLTGKRIPTVLGTLRDKEYTREFKDEDFLFPGYAGVTCVEAGGPEPGVGCAGRGIILMGETLSRLGIFEKEWDVIIYDVLGDIVCGGFAVPIREGFADAVYIVTSAEFMPLYAANNILKGAIKFAHRGGALVGGIIHNSRRAGEESVTVEEFARRTNIRVLGNIPYSEEIHKAELKAKTVIEEFPYSRVSGIFQALAEAIIENDDYQVPNALADEEMDQLCNEIIAEGRKD